MWLGNAEWVDAVVESFTSLYRRRAATLNVVSLNQRVRCGSRRGSPGGQLCPPEHLVPQQAPVNWVKDIGAFLRDGLTARGAVEQTFGIGW